MKTIFAPWRYKYVTAGKTDKCIFCDKKEVVSSEIDEATFLLNRGEYCFIILNKYPYMTGHIMVVPYRHICQIDQLTSEEMTEMMNLVQASSIAIKEVYNCHGFNMGMNIGSAAGAGIDDHLHMHLMPRWQGDTNFITSIGDTRIVPEDLDETYQKLKNSLNKIS